MLLITVSLSFLNSVILVSFSSGFMFLPSLYVSSHPKSLFSGFMLCLMVHRLTIIMPVSRPKYSTTSHMKIEFLRFCLSIVGVNTVSS